MKFLKVHIASLKEIIDRDDYKRFKSVVLAARETGLRHTSHVVDFVSNMTISLERVDESYVIKTLAIMRPLVLPNFFDLYDTTSRKSLQTRRAVQKKHEQPARPPPAVLAVLKVNHF